MSKNVFSCVIRIFRMWNKLYVLTFVIEEMCFLGTITWSGGWPIDMFCKNLINFIVNLSSFKLWSVLMPFFFIHVFHWANKNDNENGNSNCALICWVGKWFFFLHWIHCGHYFSNLFKFLNSDKYGQKQRKYNGFETSKQLKLKMLDE